jgi:hypothetical protein
LVINEIIYETIYLSFSPMFGETFNEQKCQRPICLSKTIRSPRSRQDCSSNLNPFTPLVNAAKRNQTNSARAELNSRRAAELSTLFQPFPQARKDHHPTYESRKTLPDAVAKMAANLDAQHIGPSAEVV